VNATPPQPPRPAHVPQERVVDMNIFDLPGGERDAQLAWKALSGRGDLIWTPWHGGHWITTSGELIERIYKDPEGFSNAEVGIPPKKFPVQLLPIQLDGEAHRAFRTLIMPAFHPAAVRSYAAQARALAVELIEGFRPTGRCDFVGEFSLVMPLTIFLTIVDLPLQDRVELHDLVRRSSRSPTQEARTAAFRQIEGYLGGWIERRRADPGEDLLSKIIHAKIDGRPLSQQQVLGVAILLLFAGLDTVAAMMAFVMRHLAERPELRAWLIGHPDKIAPAVEELMRRHGVANNVRTVTADVELDGVTLRRGDYIVVPNCLHGLDERQFSDALVVDFDRRPAQTGTFGWGPHHCAGANLARLEMRILLEEWLTRIPDFEIDPEAEVLEQTGTVNGVLQLPLRWSAAGR